MKTYFKPGSIALVLSLLLMLSCNRNKKDQPKSNITYSEELAKEISFVTSGDVSLDDEIKVIFNDPVIDDNEVESAPKDVFDFSPNIKGQATWESRNVLKFIPDEDLPVRTNIEGTLNLQKLSEKFKEKKLENLIFRLYVPGRMISSFNGELELKDRDDPKKLLYKGSISFSEKTELEAIEKAASIKGDNAVSLNWQKIDKNNFQFISSIITRTEKNQEFTVTIDKKPLDLEYDFSETFVVSPLKKMIANDFRTDEDGRTPRVKITFSDELDMDQNIEGLINIKPSVNVEIKKLGKSVMLDGNFKFGNQYKITIEKGIRSRWGTKTEKSLTEKIQFSDIPPQLEFASDGIILPTSNQKKIQFYTTNLKRVHLEVKKVFTDQIGQFVSSEQLSSTKTRNKAFKDNYSSAVGVIVKSKTIELGNKENEWLLNQFDLADLFSKYDDGLFLIRINFTPEDVLLPIESEVLNYIHEKGQIYKPVFLSNLGMTVKNTNSETMVFVTDIITGNPLSSVKVTLLNYRGKQITSKTTNNEGLAVFKSRRHFYYILAEDGRQTTALNKASMKWSTSGFDVGGVSENRKGTKGFIYTERGVYRPGDSIHICFMAKNADYTFPDDHPVSITVKDPKYNTVFEKRVLRGKDGFYVFGFKTKENAETGNYNIRINAGGTWFYKPLKIETVVAEKLKVLIKPQKRLISWKDNSVDYEVIASYLFGAPAANLKAEVDIEVHPHTMAFPKYKDFTFTMADVEFKSFTKNVLKKDLNDEGRLTHKWNIPSMGKVPSALKVKIIGKVLEKGGQTNKGWNVVDMHVYPCYAGIKDPSGYGYYKTGEEVKFPVIVLDAEGNQLNGKKLQYRVYRNDKRWWYQYNNRRKYQLKYKEDSKTYLETKGAIIINKGSNHIAFTPAEDGEYLVEISDGGTGHSSSLFFSSYRYGSIPGGSLNEGTLALKSDKEKYTSSETAKIKLPNPKQGKVLVTVEKGREIIRWSWIDPGKNNADNLVIEVPLNKSLLPNAYVTVSVIQPHNQTVNDRPIRMFGIIPIIIEDQDTKIPFSINTSETLMPNEDFEIEVSTQNQKPAQFTIAVVDEGLLSLTQFRTPHPWDEFYKKTGLFVETYDVFAHVISANKGDVFQTFSIGGADAMSYREAQLDPVDGKKRFKPVSMFSGPLTTDKNGKATVKFHMPNYNGAVRVMVVGTNKASFGHAEKTVRVRSDIIMQPSIPRVLNPGDEFILPVSLFKLNPDITNAQFSISTEGPLKVIGKQNINVDFSQNDEADIQFKVRVKEAVGQAKITIDGKSGNISVQSETDIKVVPTSPRVYDKLTKKLEKGESVRINVPAIGLEGTNNATLDINIFPDMDFDHRLKWLIRYPYGCIEQTTSSVFPQLFLKEMGYFSKNESNKIDKNINGGINRLQQFLVQGGGFSYWPGNTKVSEWGTNYATHFLTEAKKMGYAVPDFLYDGAINGLKSAARNHKGKLTTRVNRAFILSLANQQSMAEMNMLMENELDKMSSTEKWMLAAAYHLAGVENIRDKILSQAGTTTKEYEPFSYNFGSKSRDDAIILYCATLMKKMDAADLLARNVAKTLSNENYLSTQSSGYMLLALGKYFEATGISAAEGKVISGTVTLANGKEIDFNKSGRVTMPVKDNFNQDVKITLSNASNTDRVFVSLSWNGVPLKDESRDFQKNLDLQVKWYGENGNTINPASLKQGTTFYARFSVKNTSPVKNVSELALVQIIPSGWEIENTRLNNTLLPDWTRRWNLNKENYLDIRDDRVMWFFDLEGNITLDFVVKLNCVNAGEFRLPGTLLEAMYNNDYKATTQGKKVHVEAFK
jgi:alpha-2-macroglobulin